MGLPNVAYPIQQLKNKNWKTFIFTSEQEQNCQNNKHRQTTKNELNPETSQQGFRRKARNSEELTRSLNHPIKFPYLT